MVTGTRLRRVLRALFAVALGLGLLALLAAGFLNTTAGRAAVRAFLERWGSQAAAGTLRLGDVPLRLFRGRAELTAVRFSQPGLQVEVQRIEAAWSPRSGRSLRLVESARSAIQ